MTRLFSLAAAVATSAALLAATGGHAQTPAGYYVAVPAAQPVKQRLLTRSTFWNLRQGAYVAQRAPERDLVLCQLLAKDAGMLTSFSAGGKAYDADTLARCNTKAKEGATTAVAAR